MTSCGFVNSMVSGGGVSSKELLKCAFRAEKYMVLKYTGMKPTE